MRCQLVIIAAAIAFAFVAGTVSVSHALGDRMASLNDVELPIAC
jgi:hypothetical protein